MYTRRILFLILLSQVGLLGCHHRCHKLWNNMCRTVKREPKCFDYCDRSAVFHEMACCYWSQNMKATPCSEHFRSGFLDGFADHLHRGGTGQAPVLPPRRYWEPAGGSCRQDVIAEWRTGFAAGAESARDSGMRDQIVMPYDGLPVSQECLEPSPMAPVVTGHEHLYGQIEAFEPSTDMVAPAPAPMERITDVTDANVETEMEIEVTAEAEEAPSEYTYEALTQQVIEEFSDVEEFDEPPTIERFQSPEPTIIHLSQDIDDAVL